MGCPAPKRCTGRSGLKPFLLATMTSTRSANWYPSMSGTTPPMAWTAMGMSLRPFAQCSRRSM